MRDEIVILVTCGSREEAEKISQALLEKRLAACVNILAAIDSLFRWKGSIDCAAEVLLIIKTRRPLFAAVSETVRTIHSYETPEIIALPIIAGDAKYLAWLQEETRSL